MASIRPAVRDDLAAVVVLMNAWDSATLGEPDTSEADIASGWAESGFDVGSDAFVATDDTRVVGYAEVYDRGNGTHVDLDVVVHPDAAAPVTADLLKAAMARARERGRRGMVLSSWLQSEDPRAGAYRAAGFADARSFLRMRLDLTREVPAGDVPEGLRIVSLRAGVDEATVHRLLLEAFGDHVRPMTPQLDRFLDQHVHHPDFDADLWGVAWEGQHAVGAITVFDHGDIGFVRHIGVRADRRGRGIATALVAWAADRLRGRGQTRVDLGVDLDDDVGAARLYERLGFRPVQRLRLVERRL